MHVPRDEMMGSGWRAARALLLGLGLAAALGAACSDDDGGGGAACVGGEGAVPGAADMHCGPDDTQEIGACVPSGEGEGANEEEHPILYGREADDDDCKYHVRFENTCVAVGKPVTFTLSLTRKFDDAPGTGTNPAYPEIYLADDLTHISPSNNITAKEGPAGTYEIGPVIFDVPGRWVIRFHYFEDCSDIPEDSPHGHAAFYIDVPS
jgi:hypothetical protein